MSVLRPSKIQVTTLEKAAQTEDYNGDEAEYVLQTSHSSDGAMLAASLSNHQIRLYNRTSLEPMGVMNGHTGPITSLCFSPDQPSTLASSSEDKTVRLWDTRSKDGERAAILQQDDEALCCSLGLSTGLLAVGVGDHINFFDIRKPSSPLGQYANAHTDLVTKVLFHPTQPTTLASGSEDGLICTYNTGVSQAHESVTCIMNAECPIRDMTFFGPQGDGIAVLTGSEGMSVWHWPSARRLMEMEDLRQVSATWGSSSPHFAIQYHYDTVGERLLLATGDIQGHVIIAEVQPVGNILPIYKLNQGHQALVRCLDCTPTSLITGGEDARLCSWYPQGGGGAVAESVGMNGSGPSRGNKMRLERHRPY